MKLKTTDLQSALAKAVRGATNDKSYPITECIGIKDVPSGLMFTTTSGVNYLYVFMECEPCEFNITINAEKFTKLISKITKDEVDLTVKDNILYITTVSGEYKIGLELDEKGDPIRFPDPAADFDGPDKKIKLEDIKSIIQYNKSSLLTEVKSAPCYANYYISKDAVISTDSNRLCKNLVSVSDKSILLSPETVDLLDLMTEPEVKMILGEKAVLFRTNDVEVYGNIPEGFESYNKTVTGISKIIDAELTANCKVSRQELLNVLDRVGVFVDQKYDKNVIKLDFTKEGITITSMSSNASDVVEYAELQNYEEYSCCLNISLFVSLLKSHTTDKISLFFGNDRIVKIVDGDVIQALALVKV